MTICDLHPEDIKATLRKQFGSVFAFEDARGLPRKSVSDFLRGRPNQRVASEIAKVLPHGQADLSDDSRMRVGAHRLNGGAE